MGIQVIEISLETPSGAGETLGGREGDSNTAGRVGGSQQASTFCAPFPLLVLLILGRFHSDRLWSLLSSCWKFPLADEHFSHLTPYLPSILAAHKEGFSTTNSSKHGGNQVSGGASHGGR